MNNITGNLYGMNYGVFYPDNYKNLSLVVYLHGAGERGENFNHIYRHGLPKCIAEGSKYNAIILCPQCPADFVWDGMVKEVKCLIDYVAEKFNVKKDRISITGSSMGGFGTWSMALTYPNYFSAAAPVAGGGMSWRAGNLKTTPIKAYHGQLDNDVPPIYSQLMVDSVNKAGGNAELKVYEHLGHNDLIDYVYGNSDVVNWLVAQRRTTKETVKEALHEFF